MASLAAGLLAGCAIYRPLPLPLHDDLAAPPVAATVPVLDMDHIATLAVLNNPDLKAARARLGVASAQAFAAGILPDPQINYSTDRPLDHVNSNDPRFPEYRAYGYGLSVDLRALLTHHSAYEAASAQLRQAREELLWQEWQTVAASRTLYATQKLAEQRQAMLAPAAERFHEAAEHSQRALAEGNVGHDQADADEAILIAVNVQAGTAARAAGQAERAMRALLGLSDDALVGLAPLGAPVVPEREAIAAAIHGLPGLRPDLRALQEEYQGREALVKTAVLSQFPNIVVGVTRARDFSNVHSAGSVVSLDLPLFNRGRGDIAVQRATRAQLRAEYQARLDHATADVWQLWLEMQQLTGNLGDLDRRLPHLRSTVDDAWRAYREGNFPSASYFALANAYLNAESSHFDLLQNLWSDSIALAAMTGTQVEPVAVTATKANKQ